MRERFNKAFNYLKGQGIIKTQKNAALVMGMAESNLSNALKGDDRYLTEPFIKRFNQSFGSLFNINWLLTGDGEMLIESSSKKPYLTTKSGTKYYELPNGKFKMVVPFVPIQAYAGYIDEHRDAEFIDQLEEREFTVTEIHFGKYYSFEIKGDSMDDNSRDSLINGDIVLVRDLSREHWSDLRFKDYKAWVIVLKNTIICKQIVDLDLEKGIITCHSLNTSPEYSDFKLNLDEVCQLMNVIRRDSAY